MNAAKKCRKISTQSDINLELAGLFISVEKMKYFLFRLKKILLQRDIENNDLILSQL